MKNNLNELFTRMGEEYKDIIDKGSRHYLEVSIARKSADLGFSKEEQNYQNAFAIVPLKHPLKGMKVRIDGRTFGNYAQFDSGIVVPGYVASQVNLSREPYVAWDSMICNFA